MARVVVDDLERWARRHSRAYGEMGGTVAEGVSRGVYALLSQAIRHAPKHTGALKRSIRVLDRKKGDGAELAIHSEDPAAGMQESGGRLRGRPLMTVPIGRERAFWDATGTRREPREHAGLFRIRARDGRQYLVTREGRRLVLRYALRRTVWQDGQGWATAATEAARPELLSGIEASVVDALLATDRTV